MKHAFFTILFSSLAAVTFADAQVGRVLEAVDRLHRWDRTVVVFAGDNGFHAGEHGRFGKNTLYEEASRVPLVIATAAVKEPGTATRRVVELVDVYPTLVDLCGLPPVPGLDGVSLRPLLEDPEADVKSAAFSQYVRRPRNSPDGNRYMGYAMRTEVHARANSVSARSGPSVGPAIPIVKCA